MRGQYKCHVCGGKYREDDVMSTTCEECGNTICIYCTDLDTVTNADICDKCTDSKMFNPVETHSNASLPNTKIT